ncbi:hypothetical protein CR970_01060 [Candidatus Saccharibacteria bacterium]|nr:MAG: hypothetical protein CR970_01060 [Candidatus Saccharibacteria bacterium]
MRKTAILFIIVIPAVFGLLWAGSRGTLTINLPESAADSVITITDHKGNYFELSGPRVSKILPSGEYSVEITGDQTGWVGVINVPRFLASNTAQPDLNPEAGRAFIGDNTGSCVSLLGNKLVSYSCNSSPDYLSIHQPATGSTPGFTASMESNQWAWDIESSLVTSQGTYLFAHEYDLEDSKGGHYIYQLKEGLSLENPYHLSSMDTNSAFVFKPYGNDGYVAYNATGSLVYTANSVNEQPVLLQNIATDEYTLQTAEATGKDIVLTFTSDPEGLYSDEERVNEQLKTQVVIISGDSRKLMKIDGGYTKVVICGEEQLCAISSTKHMDVYSQKGKLQYRVGNVSDLLQLGNKLLLTTDKGLIDYDTKSRSGSYAYSYGPYEPCGIDAVRQTALVCILNPAFGERYTLQLDLQSTSDSIDKSIAQIIDSGQPEAISVSRDTVFISVDKGELAYQPSTGFFGYDPDLTKTNIAQMQELVQKAGVNRSTYNVVIE